MIRHGSLFSGIGGFDLAATWMGWRNVFHCEKDKFCNRVLQYYWPEADGYPDIKKFDGEGYRGDIDIISGGFPCQPFSVSGKRRGKTDDRYLFPQALRVITEIRPRWIVLENVAGLFTVLEPNSLSEVEHQALKLFCEDGMPEADSIIVRIQRRVLGTILSEIRSAGYLLPELADGTPVVLCIPACAVGAIHRRDRVWIIAHTDPDGRPLRHKACEAAQKRRKASGAIGEYPFQHLRQAWPAESPFCSADDVFPEGLDGTSFMGWKTKSIKAYGNAIVPKIAYELFKVIAAVESGGVEL